MTVNKRDLEHPYTLSVAYTRIHLAPSKILQKTDAKIQAECGGTPKIAKDTAKTALRNGLSDIRNHANIRWRAEFY